MSNTSRAGAKVSCRGWVNPLAEPEIAVYLGEDVEEPDRAVEAISGLGWAIDLADIDSPPEDIGDVLAGNIFHRAVILGAPNPTRADGDVAEMRARVTKNGSEVADATDLEALTGDIVSILGHTAALLGAAWEKLRAGEVLIMGSVIARYRCNRETRSLSSWLHCADLGEGLDPGALDRLPNPRRIQWEAQ